MGNHPTRSVADSRARRAAKRMGLIAQKTRWRRDTVDNMGGFRLIDPHTNAVVDGARFESASTAPSA